MATVTAILFGIHPMHLEAVAWISARKDVLYGFFFISGLVTYLYFLKKCKHRLGLYLLCLAMFTLALLSKGMAVTFPLILWCIDFLFRRRNTGMVLLEKMPFLMLSIGFGIIAVVAEQEGEAMAELNQYAYSETIVVGFYTITVYVIKALIPFHLSAFHPYPNLDGGAMPWFYYGAVIAMALLLYLAYRVGRRYREVGFGSAFFLVSILPVSQILPVGSAVIAERYTYIAYIGLFFLMGFALNQLCKTPSTRTRRYRIACMLLCSGFVLLMGGITYQRSAVWQNGETLWSDVIKKYPDDYFAYGNRGNYRLSVGNRDGAMADLSHSLRLNPQFFEGYNNRGMLYLRKRDYRRAHADFNRAIEINDQYFKAFLNRGVVYMTQGRYPQALADLNRALQLAPEFPQAFHARGVLYRRMKQFDAAIRDLSAAINLTPENPVLYQERATAYYLSNRPDAARRDARRAHQLNVPVADASFEMRSR